MTVFSRRLDYYVSPKKLPDALIEVAETNIVSLFYFTYIERETSLVLESLSIVVQVLIFTETSYIAVIRTRDSYPYGTIRWTRLFFFFFLVIVNVSIAYRIPFYSLMIYNRSIIVIAPSFFFNCFNCF